VVLNPIGPGSPGPGSPASGPGRSDAAQPWEGDDQAWWDWYVTTADNDADNGDGGDLVDLDRPAAVEAAADWEVAVALAEPYPLRPAQIEAFRTYGYVRLPGVVSAPVVAALARRLEDLLTAEFGPDTAGRFLSLEMMWLTDDLMRSVALSPRLGGIAARLLGEPAVRLYHDNALSKQPGCGRTPWHSDADHFPLDSTRICTSWFPLHPVPAAMGPLSFAAGVTAAQLGRPDIDQAGTAYDAAVAAGLARRGDPVDRHPFALGDVSFHSAACFHTAGANRTTSPRRVLSNIYLADDVRVVDHPGILSGTWREFLPGVEPGDLAASAYNPVVGVAG
jgi:hypothetical protein